MNPKSAPLNSPTQPQLARLGLCLAALLLLLQPLTGWAQSGTWTNTAGGSWTDTLNWTNGIIADGTDSTADFSTLNLAANATVTLDGARTIGILMMGDTTTTYFNGILNPGSGDPLTMAVSSGTPRITAKNGSAVINTVIAGTGGLRLTSSPATGYVQLNAANTYSGGTIVGDAALVSIGNAQAIGSGLVQFGDTSGGGQNWVQAAGADRTVTNDVEIRTARLITGSATVAGQVAGNLTLSGSVLLNQGAGAGRDFFCQKTLTLAGPVSGGPAGLNLVAGKLILQGSNTFTNGVNLTVEGASVQTLNINADAALGAAANGINFATKGTLQAGATPITVAATRTINITNNAYANIDVPTSSYVMTLAGPVTSSQTNGSVHKIGAGTLVLDSGVTTRLKGLITSAGTNEWRSGNLILAAGANPGAGQITNGFNNDGGTFLLTGGSITATNGNYIIPAGNGGAVSVFTQTGGTFDGGGQQVLNAYGVAGTFNLNGGTFICGPFRVAQSAGGVLNLNGGMLKADYISSGTANNPVYFNGGTLQAKSTQASFFNSTLGALPAMYIKNGGAFIDSSTFAITIPIAIQADAGSTGGLTKLGSGTLSLTASNSYAGNTTNTAGTLTLGNTNALGTGTLVLVSNSVLASAAGVGTGNGVTNPVVLAANSTMDSTGGNLKLTGGISGPGALTKTGASFLILGGINTYSGGTTNITGNLLLNSPGVSVPGNLFVVNGNIQLGAANQIADSAIFTFSNAATARFQMQGYNETLGGLQDSGGANPRIVEAAQDSMGGAPATLTLNVAGSSAYSFGGFLRDAAGTNNSPLSVTKDGPGTQTFSGSGIVTYSGPTVINDGLLEFSGANSAVDASAITINSGGTVKFSGGGTHSALISGAGNLIAAGATALTLSGTANSYTGSTTITNGTIIATTLANGGANSSIGAAASDAANLVLDGGTLNYGGTTTNCDRNFTIAAAKTATFAVASAVADLTLTGSAPTTTGFLKKTGNGILTLNPGAGSYSVGCLSADAGSLVLKSGTFTTTGLDPFNVGYLVGAGARGGKLVVDGGTLNVTGGARMTLAAAANGNLDILSGTVNAGDLVLGHNATAIGTQSGGSVNVTNLYHIDGGNGTNTITGGLLTVKRIYNLSTVAGPYFNLILNGGIVRAAAGTVNLMDNAGLAGAELIVQLGTNGATIDTSLSDAKIVRPLDDLPGQVGTLTKIGAGTLTLASNNTYTGSTTISNGTLRVNGAISTGAVAVRSAATLGGSGSIGGEVTVEADATLQPGLGGTDSSALTVANNVSLAGTTLIGINRTNVSNSARLVVTGTLTNGGTLTVTNVGDALEANDTFTLFTLYAVPSGTFSATNLPTLGAGTNWWAATQDTTNVVILVNAAPTAGDTAYTRAAGVGLKNISIANVLTNVTNVSLGQSISLLSVSSPSSNGAAVSISGGNIQYSPSVGSTNNDSFTYTVSDGRGGTATGNIAVNVIAVTGQDSGVITVTGTNATTVFAGIPDWVYIVQRSTNLTDWVSISTNTTPPSGLITNVDNFIDLNPPPYPSSAYYRLQSQ